MSDRRDGQPPDLSPRRLRIADELERIEESARDSGTGQFEQAAQWRGVNLMLGVPASGLAAVAGAIALGATTSTSRLIAGALALGSAAFGAILTVVNAAQRTSQATSAGNAYRQLQTDARQARLVDLPWQDDEQARSALSELTVRRDEINKGAEPPNRLAWWRARRSHKRGSQTYAVDGKERD